MATNIGSKESPLYLEIAERFEAQRAALTAPLKLSSEQHLAEEFGIARDTVRRAMVVLERRGAVTRRPGRGTFLRPLQSRPVSARGSTIGFVPPWWVKAGETLYPDVFGGISGWADEHDCRLSVMRVERLESDEHKLLEKVAARGLSGLVWVHPVTEQKPLLAAVSRHIPCVAIGREYRDMGLHSVVPDYGQAMSLIDEHLVSLGHTTYSIVGRSSTDPYGASWVEAACDAFLRRGAFFDEHEYYVNITPFDRKRLVELMMDFHLAHHPDSRAMVLTSSSYLVPLLASERFRAAVPDSVSLVSFDYGVQAMNTYWPGRTITHVHCDWNEIGRKAIDVLFSLIAGSDSPMLTQEPVTLIEGDTVSRWHRSDGGRSNETGSKT